MNPAALESPSQRYATLLNRLIDSRDWPRSLDTARAWLSEDPESAKAHLSAGQALVNLTRYPEALPHLAKALAATPNNAFAHRLMSLACFRVKQFTKADEHIERAIALQPEGSTHWYHLAWMRYMQGAPDLAVKHAAHALELAPQDANILNLLALCQRSKPEERLAQYRRALELDPENGTVHGNIGLYHLHAKGDAAAAEACFRRALQIDPKDKSAQRNLLIALRRSHWGYQVLRFPLSLWDRATWARRDLYLLAHLAALVLCLTATDYWYVLFGWIALVYPLQKAYEYLTLGDLQAEAGVPGARRGGLLGYRRWPFAARLGVFAVLTLGFWGGVYTLVLKWETHPIPGEALGPLALVGCFALLIFFVFRLVSMGKRTRLKIIAQRSEKRFARQLKAANR